MLSTTITDIVPLQTGWRAAGGCCRWPLNNSAKAFNDLPQFVEYCNFSLNPIYSITGIMDWRPPLHHNIVGLINLWTGWCQMEIIT